MDRLPALSDRLPALLDRLPALLDRRPALMDRRPAYMVAMMSLKTRKTSELGALAQALGIFGVQDHRPQKGRFPTRKSGKITENHGKSWP